MIIGGLQKNSFIDYPGKICCVLFVEGCNFHCPYCHNPELVTGEPAGNPPMREKEVFEFLESRLGFLDGVTISGGEPTLQPDLVSFCKKIRSMGLPVKLDTNGSRPEVISQLLHEGVIDYLAMDIKADPAQYVPLIKKQMDPELIYQSIHMVMSSGLPYEFRTTCVRPFIDKEVITRIGEILHGARLYALQKVNLRERMLDPDFFREKDMGFSDGEMKDLMHCAEQYVKECIIR